MNPTETRKLGKTGVELTQLGFGGAPLGELFVKVDEPTAAATLQAAWDAGVRYYDTAPYYGRGLSEIRYRPLPGRQAEIGVRAVDQGRPLVLPARRPRSVRDRASGPAACASITCTTTATTASCAPTSSRTCGSA